jgi:hypothetical protein
MKKLTTAALAGLVAVATTANASLSRWNGFGDIGSAFIADVQDIWTLPGAITNYKNALYSELGPSPYSAGVWGGAHMELGPGVLGVWGNRPVDVHRLLDYQFPGYSSTTDPNESLDVIYGFNLGDATALGVGLSRASYGELFKDKGNGNDEENNYNTNVLGLSLGLEQKNLGPISLLEVGLQYSMLSAIVSEKDNVANTEDKGNVNGSDIALRVGADVAGEEGRFGRAELGFQLNNATGKWEPNSGSPQEETYNTLGYNVGYAVGKSGDAGLGLAGVMLRGRTDKKVEKDAFIYGDGVKEWGVYTLAIGFAGEGKVAPWLSIRGGLSVNALHNLSYTENDFNNPDEEKWTYSTTQYGVSYDLYGGQQGTASFGTSLTFGNLTIDGVLDQALLWNGPYFVTGTSSGLNTQVSATWAW